MNYQNFYIGRVLNAFSQLLNAFINGSPDVSISARVGYNNYFYNDTFYKFCGWVIDKTFFPIDGNDHCRKGYLRDRKEDYTIGSGYLLPEIGILLITICFCVPLSILFWSYYLIKKIL